MTTFWALGFLVLFLLGGLLVFVDAARAQELPTPAKTPTAEPQAPDDAKQAQATAPTETKEEEKARKKEEREKKKAKYSMVGRLLLRRYHL